MLYAVWSFGQRLAIQLLRLRPPSVLYGMPSAWLSLDPQAPEVASSADAIKARLEPCQQLFHKFAGSALTSRNAAAQTAAVYAVQHFWHQAGSPPE